uniref:Lysine-specific demethylase 7A n=1 Tax=Pygocentrus nattereri TaxID=42514 RepID=A0AAR2K189_PYGNA
MATAPLYCVCRQPYDVSRFMIECDICKDWFHGSCVQVEEHHAVDIDVYHCPNCEIPHGPSLMKKRNNWHRHDYTEPDDGSKPVQAGTFMFVQKLQTRTFASSDEILTQMHGSQVTQRYLERHGFRYPIAVTQLDGLGLRLPPSDFSVKDVERYVGGHKVIDVIDVARQADSKMRLKEFVKYYYSPQRPKVLNVISLEFSDTKMSDLVVVPDIAQKMSWVENYWPDDSYFPKPFVQKYCLMSVKDSYTDFHIDFGGTSVWYHVLWGEKIFYLIKPSPTNLALYEEWSSSPNQSEMFFGEKVDKCYKCVVRQGTTLFIPTGWIHAVLTSQDCMAFGGNFLHNLNISMQLRCYEMERRLKTPDLFKFPYFEAICWYVAKNLLETLKELREDNCLPPEYLIKGVKALITALKHWLRREVTEPASEVPDHIRPNHLIKELTKEIRLLESGSGGNKPMKTQGSLACLSTRSSHERGLQAPRNGRRLRHHHHHRDSHAPKAPSNLDIFEQHTQEVLKRLEIDPFEEDSSFSPKVNFNKLSTASAAAAERSLDNHLHLRVHNLPYACYSVDVLWICVCRDPSTSPSTEEDAIQGMLSMAGLLFPHSSEEGANSQESWCQGSCSSSEAWGSHTHSPGREDSPPSGYQYCETSLSPPLHPSKRLAPNPPPISNQATKGKRPKKGMATAKQRLGKILKLNRHEFKVFLLAFFTPMDPLFLRFSERSGGAPWWLKSISWG